MRHAAAVLLMLILAPAARGESLEEMRALSEAVSAAVDRVAPSVVTIETYGGAPVVKGLRRSGDEEKGPLPLVRPGVSPNPGPTTGTVLSADGWIVASAFAFLDAPTTIVVTLADGRSMPARLAGTDLSRGIALLRVEAEDLPAPEAVPPEEVEVGQWALSVGRGLAGERPTVQMGIVSALDRISGRAIQTDALVSPANFGGPLVDLRGRVLGVLVPLSRQGLEAAVRSYDSGIGFAVPFARMAPVLDWLKAGETIHPAFLGVQVDTSSIEPGARITKVLDGTAAATAGLAADDVVLAVDGRVLPCALALLDAVGRHVEGDRATIRYRRGEAVEDVEVTLGRPPEGAAAEPEEVPGEDDGKKKDGEGEKDGGR